MGYKKIVVKIVNSSKLSSKWASKGKIVETNERGPSKESLSPLPAMMKKEKEDQSYDYGYESEVRDFHFFAQSCCS